MLAIPPALAEPEPPSLTIEHLNATLLSVMKEAEELGFEGRYQQLLPVIIQEFDLPFVARYTLGSSWDELNEEQRGQFIEIFQELSVTDYARHFDGYSGQHFTIEEEAPLPRSGMRVRSKLIDPDGSSVVFDYLLHKADSQWRIVNVIANGVSDLAVKRAEYRHIIKTEGFNSLLNKLKAKIAPYREQAEGLS
jgi:phospholipid transport system substrate-binding protein